MSPTKRARPNLTTIAAWAAASAIIAVSVVWGRRLQQDHPEMFLGAAPLVGQDPRDGWDWRFGWGLVGAAAVAGAFVVAIAMGWWERCSRAVIRLTSAVAAGLFGVLLAATDGRDGLLRGAAHETEYLANLEITGGWRHFIETFVDDIQQYSVHVRGHPPGFVVLLQALDAIGLSGPWPVVGLSILGTALLPVAVLVAVGRYGGAEWERSVAPLLAVSPYAIWMMTSADALYSALGAASVACVAIALRREVEDPAGMQWLFGGASGLLLGLLLHGTYGGAMFALAPMVLVVAAAVHVRRTESDGPFGHVVQVAIAATVGVAAVTAVFVVLGFWWLDGAQETRRQYWNGTAQFRPMGYFAIANLAAALIAIGPVGFAGLARWLRSPRRWPAVWPLVIGGVLALLGSHASQYTRAEVERIWLLFYPWLIVASGVLLVGASRRRAAMIVAIQAAAAIALQAALVTKW